MTDKASVDTQPAAAEPSLERAHFERHLQSELARFDREYTAWRQAREASLRADFEAYCKASAPR